MVEDTKEMLDVAAASTAVLSMAAWLPPTASILTIVWLGIRIYESDTVQSIVKGTKNSLTTKTKWCIIHEYTNYFSRANR